MVSPPPPASRAAAAMGQGSYRFTDEERFGNVALLEAIVRSAENDTLERVAQYEE